MILYGLMKVYATDRNCRQMVYNCERLWKIYLIKENEIVDQTCCHQKYAAYVQTKVNIMESMLANSI